MALIDKLTTQGSVYTGLNGSTPTIPNGAQSTLHNEYSLNGTPAQRITTPPSILDLDGVTPPTYRDNAPEGASF